MRRVLVALSLLLLAAGCAGEKAVIPTDINVGGIYSLRTVNGSPLPFVYYEDALEKYEIVDDTITLSDIGTWSKVSHERGTVKGVATVLTYRDGGFFTRQATAILLSNDKGRSTPGTLVGNDLIFAGARASAVYTR